MKKEKPGISPKNDHYLLPGSAPAQKKFTLERLKAPLPANRPLTAQLFEQNLSSLCQHFALLPWGSMRIVRSHRGTVTTSPKNSIATPGGKEGLTQPNTSRPPAKGKFQTATKKGSSPALSNRPPVAQVGMENPKAPRKPLTRIGIALVVPFAIWCAAYTSPITTNPIPAPGAGPRLVGYVLPPTTPTPVPGDWIGALYDTREKRERNRAALQGHRQWGEAGQRGQGSRGGRSQRHTVATPGPHGERSTKRRHGVARQALWSRTVC